MNTIVLTVPYPISENRYKLPRIIRLKGQQHQTIMWYHSAEAKVFIAECQKAALAVGLAEPLQGRVELSYRLYPHRPQDWQKRMRTQGPWWADSVQCIDLYNAVKVMADALQGIVYANDKQVHKGAQERMDPDEYGARMVVYVRAIERPAPPQQELIA